MEAKDTVMSIPELWDAYKKQPEKYEVIAAIEAQAEISFEAGVKQERERILSMIWEVQSGVGHGSGRVSKDNLQALKDQDIK